MQRWWWYANHAFRWCLFAMFHWYDISSIYFFVVFSFDYYHLLMLHLMFLLFCLLFVSFGHENIVRDVNDNNASVSFSISSQGERKRKWLTVELIHFYSLFKNENIKFSCARFIITILSLFMEYRCQINDMMWHWMWWNSVMNVEKPITEMLKRLQQFIKTSYRKSSINSNRAKHQKWHYSLSMSFCEACNVDATAAAAATAAVFYFLFYLSSSAMFLLSESRIYFSTHNGYEYERQSFIWYFRVEVRYIY